MTDPDSHMSPTARVPLAFDAGGLNLVNCASPSHLRPTVELMYPPDVVTYSSRSSTSCSPSSSPVPVPSVRCHAPLLSVTLYCRNLLFALLMLEGAACPTTSVSVASIIACRRPCRSRHNAPLFELLSARLFLDFANRR